MLALALTEELPLMTSTLLRTAPFFLLCGAAALAQPALRLNQIQVIGSHNSYHAGLAPREAALFESCRPGSTATVQYRHPPLDVQFSRGVRQIELDIWADSRGGRFSSPFAVRLVAGAGLPPDPPFDPAGLLRQPGFKVFHMQDVDYRSTCQVFVECLGVVRRWSDQNPRHLPIFVLVETKDERPHPEIQTEPEPFTAATFDTLDREIRSVFPDSRLITPDRVRSRHATLNQAIRVDGWPTLDSARGKIVFLLDQRRAGPVYLQGHPSLSGRVAFTNAEPGSPDAAFVEVNDPLQDPALIPSLVRQGYLVRTRTDANLVQARSGDPHQRDAALSSGAQLLSTDYPFEERATWTGYSVSFPHAAIARCNPVLHPPHCTAVPALPPTH
jgi:hypothetical protein